MHSECCKFLPIFCTVSYTSCCACAQITFSIVSMAVGFQYLVCGGAGSQWTMISLFCSFFSLFTFAVAVAYTGFLSAKESFDFIPSEYGASTSEVKAKN